MQDHPIVALVPVVSVGLPVAGAPVQLHIASNQGPVIPGHDGIADVGAFTLDQTTSVNDLEQAALRRG